MCTLRSDSVETYATWMFFSFIYPSLPKKMLTSPSKFSFSVSIAVCTASSSSISSFQRYASVVYFTSTFSRKDLPEI